MKFREYSKLLLVFGMALLLRFFFVLQVSPHIPLAPDTIYGYDKIANNILNGSGFSIKPGVPTVTKEPIYPLLLSSIYFLFGYNHTIVRIIQAMLDSLTCLVLYFIGRKVYNEQMGLLSAIALAFYPVSIYATGLILTETLFTFLQSIFVVSLLMVFESRLLRYSMLSGFLLGVSVMTRGSVSMLPVFVLIGLVLVFRDSIKLAMAKAVLIFLFMSLVIAPWTVRNYQATGVFVPIRVGGGLQLLTSTIDVRDSDPTFYLTFRSIAVPEDVNEVERDQLYFRAAIAKILKDPLMVLRLTLKRLYRFWYWTESGTWDMIALTIQIPLVFFGLIGIFSSFRCWQKVIPLVLTILYFTLLHAASRAILRYAAPIMPYVILFAIHGLLETGNKCSVLLCRTKGLWDPSH